MIRSHALCSTKRARRGGARVFVLSAVAAARADRTDDLAVGFDGQTAGEDDGAAVQPIGDPVKVAARLRDLVIVLVGSRTERLV